MVKSNGASGISQHYGVLEAQRAASAELERLNRIESEFIAVVCHVLRTLRYRTAVSGISAAIGRVNQNVEPLSGVLSAQMRPPCI